jgi:hypothetical protein
MGVSHVEIDLQIAAERDANARDTPCLFSAPVDCRVGGLTEIVEVGAIGDDEGGYNLLSQHQQAGGHTIF